MGHVWQNERHTSTLCHGMNHANLCWNQDGLIALQILPSHLPLCHEFSEKSTLKNYQIAEFIAAQHGWHQYTQPSWSHKSSPEIQHKKKHQTSECLWSASPRLSCLELPPSFNKLNAEVQTKNPMTATPSVAGPIFCAYCSCSAGGTKRRLRPSPKAMIRICPIPYDNTKPGCSYSGPKYLSQSAIFSVPKLFPNQKLWHSVFVISWSFNDPNLKEVVIDSKITSCHP